MIDTIMMLTCVLFGYSLIPQVIDSIKTRQVGINTQTLICTSVGMITVLPCYAYLHLWMTLALSAVTASCWVILLVLKIIYALQAD